LKKGIKVFKIISSLEAISFIVLLFIAMPLKYIWDMPQLVKVVGNGPWSFVYTIHCLCCICLARVTLECQKAVYSYYLFCGAFWALLCRT